MALPTLTYTLNGKTYLADPLTQGLPDVVLVTQKEDSQAFYRTKWQGDITFVGVDFQLFWKTFQLSCCQKVFLSLYRSGVACSASDPYWKGFFNLSDLQFASESGLAKLTTAPRPDDGYQTLLENWETPINWLLITSLNSAYSADRTTLYRRARRLIDLLVGMVNLTLKDTTATSLIPSTSTDVVSVFLEASLNPVTRRTNPLQNAVVVQGSDFVAPGTAATAAANTGYATKTELSLKDLVTELQELLCLYPYIHPATGKLRWEHESFFPSLSYDPPVAGFSLPATDPAWTGKKNVKSDLDDLYGKYKLTITPNLGFLPAEAAESNTTPYQFPVQLNNPYGLPNLPIGTADPNDPTASLDFSIGNIDFSSYCVSRTQSQGPITKERTVNHFCTDVVRARVNASSVNKADWIFLLAVSPSTDVSNNIPQVAYGVVDTHGVNVENGSLAASSLVRDFHRHNKPFADGIYNKSARYLAAGIKYSSLSVLPIRQLDQVTIPFCCTDSPLSLSGQIQTWLASDGQLIQAQYHLATNQLALDFAHPGPCQIGPHPPFDANGNPLPCPPRGAVLRLEQSAQYPPGNNTIPCIVRVSTVYTDGACGEYKITETVSNGTC